jgi:alpha-D-ribose 1-methylphosphonate 5-triphosphate synthase subunit PhnG
MPPRVPRPPEVRARIAAGRRAAWADPEVRARQVASAKALWQDPDYRARVLAAQQRGKDRAAARRAAVIDATFRRALARIQGRPLKAAA